MSGKSQYDDDWFTEDKCRRCGVCCGSQDGHPCEHLAKDGDKYYCTIYPNRFGIHRTTTGRLFRCVPIREIIEANGGFPGCGYVKPHLMPPPPSAPSIQQEKRV